MDVMPRTDDFPLVVRPGPGAAAAAETPDREDVEHFVVCLECGQGYDRHNLTHALYHAEPDHDPFFVGG